MKTIKNILAIAVLLGAVNARADYSMSATLLANGTPGAAINLIIGDGSSYVNWFTFTPGGSEVGKFRALGSSAVSDDPSAVNVASVSYFFPDGTTPLANLTPLTLGSAYKAKVTWNLTGFESIGSYAISFTGAETFSGNNFQAASGSAVMYINVSQVPEPGQTIAGLMLLGCGGLVFVGRKMLKKQVA